MATTKDERIYIRVKKDIKTDFETAAEYRGLTPSAMLHSFIVKTVHEARLERPEIFLAAKSSAPPQTAEPDATELPSMTYEELIEMKRLKEEEKKKK